MASYVALLRAVNLAGKNTISMGDLRALAQKVGLREPRTLLASGNLIFESGAKGSAALEKLLEIALSRELQLVTPVVVRSVAEWRAAIADNPFAAEARKAPGQLLLMPLKGKPVAGGLTTLAQAIVGRERVKAVGSSLYLVYPDGVGRSKLTSALIEKKVGVAGTARNWNTVQKVLAELEAST
ncbi:MAG TPA: DUF1697 domain-containing protein [Polyangiaceae bacterium]|nr:DUF1697 domain-containing protein [Polyangiaceae bacterium]